MTIALSIAVALALFGGFTLWLKGHVVRSLSESMAAETRTYSLVDEA